jgi:hypothetical protein
MTTIDENRSDKAHANHSGLAWKKAFKPIPEIFGWYGKHTAAGTLILAAFLVVKGCVIARGNLTTALGILQYAGLTSVVIAGLLSSLPILTSLMLGWFTFRIVKGWFAGFPPGLWKALVWVLLGSLVLSVFFAPVPYMLAAIILGSLAGLVEGRRATVWRVRAIRVVAGVFVLLATLWTLYTVWVPREIVRLRPGEPGIGLTPNERAGYVLGYVLADDPGGWITILTSGDRTIVRFRDAAVSWIRVCERTPHGGVSDISYASPLWNNILRPGTNRACP